MSNEETRGGISKERVTTEIAKLTVALEARDAEIATLRANLESVAAGKGLVVDFQNANGAGDAAPASEETTQETPKSAEEAELEELLNEVMQLKGENASLEAARGGAGEGRDGGSGGGADDGIGVRRGVPRRPRRAKSRAT